MRRTVTLEKVREAYQALEQQGEPTSVRNIVALTGGSNSTVTPLIRQYEEQRRKEHELNFSMSRAFRQAYIDDILSAVSQAKMELESSLASALEHEQYLLNELIQREEQVKNLQTEVETTKSAAEAESQAYANHLSALKQQVTDFEQELLSYKQEAFRMQKEINELNSDLSTTKLLLSQAEGHAQLIHDTNANLREKADNQQRLIAEFEKMAEISKDRAKTTLQQLDEIKVELSQAREKLDAERERRIEAEMQLSVLQVRVKSDETTN